MLKFSSTNNNTQTKVEYLCVQTKSGVKSGISAMENNVSRKFIIADLLFEDGSKKRVMRIAKSSNFDIQHRYIYDEMLSEFKDILIKPLYGGRVLRDDDSKTIFLWDRSLGFPAEPNWVEVTRILREGLEKEYSSYSIKCDLECDLEHKRR